MAPTKSKSVQSYKNTILGYVKKYATIKFAKALLFDPSKLAIVAAFIILTEFVLNVYIIEKVKYTEIDWVAYMQECEGFLNGTTDYSLLRGDTGPLVYPAGFVYIYSLFYFLTSGGQAVRVAQYIFLFIYIAQMLLVLRLYIKSRKVPPYVLALSALTSYRVHSIYVLRLFNDPVAILLFYIALNLYIESRWTLASVFLSLAVSVKMNILLFAPAILCFYILNLGLLRTLLQLGICGFIQLLLGLPFLIENPVAYIKGSFDLGRVFEHQWTVNYRFLDKEVFENRIFHIGLLVLQLLLLIAFSPSCYKYMQGYVRLRVLQKQLQPQIEAKNKELKVRNKVGSKSDNVRKRNQKKTVIEEKLTPDQQSFLNGFEKQLKKAGDGKINSTPPEQVVEKDPCNYSIHFDYAVQLALLPIYVSNLVGIACARSLHYQFYVWYFHSLPHLTWSTDYSTPIKFLILAVIELCWNTYPSTFVSSLLLHICHLVLLTGLFKKMRA